MNPELQRNLWLEITPRRLAWAGVALAVIYGVTLVVVPGSPEALAGVGVVVFGCAALIWGPRAAGRSIGGEVAQRTWDFQRLSALTPWTLAWGKLVGSTSLSWLVALTGLALTTVRSILGHHDPATAAAWIVEAVGLGLMLQAGALALGLIGVRRARAEGRIAALRMTPGTLVGFLAVIWAMSHVISGRGRGDGGPLTWLGGGDIEWWGGFYPSHWFVALSIAVFAAWAVLAVWRLMRLELQAQSGPWTWSLFVLFAGAYAAGFARPATLSDQFAVAGGAFAICAYAAAFAEPADRVALRMWAGALARLDIRRVLTGVPAAIAPLKLAALAAVGVLVVEAPTPIAPYDVNWKMAAAAALAFLVRDLGVIAFFRFGPRAGRGDFGAVLGLFLLYFAGVTLGRTLLGEEGGALFMPVVGHASVSLASGFVQAIGVWVLAWNRIRAAEVRA